MYSLITNIRFWILFSSICLSILIFFVAPLFYDSEKKGVLRTTEVYAFVSLAYLYIALTIGPATKILTFLPFRALLVKARRAVGVSSFYFASLHGIMAFTNLLGGVEGIMVMPPFQLFSVFLGVISLLILLVMSITSFDAIVAKLTYPKWKFLHRFVYLAFLLVILHASLLGNHFSDPLEAKVKYATYFMVSLLVIFHIYGLYLKQKMKAPSA